MGQVNGLIGTLEVELKKLDVQIGTLSEYRASIQHTLELYRKASELPSGNGHAAPTTAPKYKPQPVVKTAPKKVASKSAPVEKKSPITDGPKPKDAAPSTLEMTRTILKNAGGATMKLDDIKTAIRQMYGIAPAKSLDQMISKRAAKNKGFYVTPNREFGLSELRTVVTPVTVPATAIA